jgi:hypothetical protein
MLVAGWGERRVLVRNAAAPHEVVILREGRGSSTPQLFDSSTGVAEYWITRFRG